MGLLKVLFNGYKEQDEEEFEKEAKKYNLSKRDKEMARNERMTPAEYVEAEERDDDNLYYDE